MKIEMEARVEKTSYVPSEEFRLFLRWDHQEISISELGNMSVNIFRVEVERNSLAVGFGTCPRVVEDDLVLQFALPQKLPSGLHVVSGVTLTEVRGKEMSCPLQITFAPIFFEIRPHFQKPTSELDLAVRLNGLEKKRAEFINQTHTTDAANGDPNLNKSYRVTVFGVGCLIHDRQQLAGYRIDPLRTGLSHQRFLELVNKFLSDENYDGLPFLKETEAQFQRSTPAIAITFPHVQAIDHEDALSYCRSRCELLFQLLGFERGQIPREFAYLAMQHGTRERWHGFEMPGYRGNLLADINPTQLANSIEKQLPLMEKDPFTRLLLRSFAEATGERDFGFRILRLWTVLELAADRAIGKGQNLKHPDGTLILKANGQPETTNSKHGRVYEYILSGGAFASMSVRHEGERRVEVIIGDKSDKRIKPETIVVTLWEMIQAVYAIRCAVAHEGYFDASKRSNPGEVLASDFLERGFPDLLDFTKANAQLAIWRARK